MRAISWLPRCLGVRGIKHPKTEIIQGYVKAMPVER